MKRKEMATDEGYKKYSGYVPYSSYIPYTAAVEEAAAKMAMGMFLPMLPSELC